MKRISFARFLSILVISAGARLYAEPPAPPQMRFQAFTITDDPNYIGGPVARCLIPAGWKSEGGMVWDLSNAYPAQVKLKIFDPNSAAAFETYPAQYFYWNPRNRAFPPGSKYSGELVREPVKDQFDAAAQVVIPAFRPDLADAKVVETEKLPKISALVLKNLPPRPNAQVMVQAGRIRFEYQIKDQTVQEDLYLVYRQDNNPNLGTSWVVENVTSVRGPKGKLDELKEMHDVMLRSSMPNLEWSSQYQKLVIARFNKETIDAIHAGEAARKQANQAHQLSDEERKSYEDLQRNNDAMSEARAETTRGQTPWVDADGSKVLLPAEYGHAWRDDNGQYIVTNDVGYNPNSDLSLHSNWTAMDQVK